jgi:hypothetical protein
MISLQPLMMTAYSMRRRQSPATEPKSTNEFYGRLFSPFLPQISAAVAVHHLRCMNLSSI